MLESVRNTQGSWTRAPRACAPARTLTREAGFTLVEIVVVLLIMGVLMAILAGAGRSSSHATATQAAVSVARSYGDAIEAFSDEHGGRAPLPGSEDWPARPAGSPTDLPEFAAGPRNVAAGDRPYLAKLPEPVSTGSLLFNAGTASQEPPDHRGITRVSYRAGSGTGWRLDVEISEPVADSDAFDWRVVCTLGPMRSSSEASC